jgi:[protein-PII] uridylyltransferase
MVKDELLDLIRSDGPELQCLRRFYNQGLLTSLIPELSAAHGLVQHDAFHLYPVQEHHLRTVGELKRLVAGEYAESEPELTQMAKDLGDPVWLYLAGLLHDIGKSSGSGHALHGGEMIPAIARRLGLGPEESDTVQFLVAQHVLLMDSASLRDLADQEMLSHCALVIANVELLDLLALISFADMAATGPKAQQKWRDTPLLPLYGRVRHILEKGEPSPQAIAERIDHIRNMVRNELADLLGSEELESSFSQLAPRYLLSTSPSGIALHLRLLKRLQTSGEPCIWEAKVKDGNAEITLMSRQLPGLLSRAAGILTLHDMNIIEAQIYTLQNDVLLLIFKCRMLGVSGSEHDWDAVKNDMMRLLQGKMALDYRIRAHAASRKYPQAMARHTPSQILIDNDSSEIYTILEVHTSDRVGLLYTITRTLHEMQIRIYVAKITTKVDKVADVFYIKSHRGEKVTDPDQMDEIKNALRFWLDDSMPA